jgi:pimeloyl-ACP methyl ester carboxylesterase
MAMNIGFVYPPQSAPHGRVIALHCSGSSSSEWGHLTQALGGRYEVAAPEHYGAQGTGPWGGEHAFTLDDEAVRSIALIDARDDDKVHLVGHSYGGGVALNIALARPDRIASMVLYEPTAFHLLRQLGERGAEPYAEITGVARSICQGVVTGDYRGAVAAFVDYWNGPGAWNALRPAVQSALIRWAPKGPLDFRALIDDPTPADAYRRLTFPVLILRGEHAPSPTRAVAEGLLEYLPASGLAVIAGAGHMGPLTHSMEVSALIVRHILQADSNADTLPYRSPRRNGTDIAGTARQRTEVPS